MINNMRDAIAHYDDMLDEVASYRGIMRSTFFEGYEAADALRAGDPIAYRVGFHDYMDALYQDGEAEDIDEWFEEGYLP